MVSGSARGLTTVPAAGAEAGLTIELRPMAAADLPAVARVESIAYPGALLEGEEALAAHRAAHPEGCTVAAVVGTGELAGYILSGPARLEDCPLMIESTPESDKESSGVGAGATAETLYLHDISVLPEFRKFGLGRRLVATVEALAAELGAPTITLTAVAGAWDHWLRLGFVELARKSDAAVSPGGLLSEAAVQRLKSYPTEAVFMRRVANP